MIILNYKKHYENLVRDGFQKFSNMRDLNIMAHVMAGDGLRKNEISAILLEYCRLWDKHFIEPVTISRLNKIVSALDKPLPSISDKIILTEVEKQNLAGIEDYELHRVLFAIVALLKFMGKSAIYISSKSSIKLKDIFDMAGVKKSCQNQELMLHSLYEMGMLKVTFNLRYSIPWLNDNGLGESEIEINSAEDIMLQYEFFNGKAIRCKDCGALVHKSNNKIKYCKACAQTAKLNSDKEHYKNLRK